MENNIFSNLVVALKIAIRICTKYAAQANNSEERRAWVRHRQGLKIELHKAKRKDAILKPGGFIPTKYVGGVINSGEVVIGQPAKDWVPFMRNNGKFCNEGSFKMSVELKSQLQDLQDALAYRFHQIKK